jgi:hypothetical protein
MSNWKPLSWASTQTISYLIILAKTMEINKSLFLKRINTVKEEDIIISFVFYKSKEQTSLWAQKYSSDINKYIWKWLLKIQWYNSL